ncbi:hypothetical protein ABL78_2427 [Leptomonas seymouri]|uniref:EF-hand domain-containing protein n=1 Tax=Leptomonas seymouri TaxID=5684 RepID=A0A0N1HZ95_LEPSE|nr:hypothetical protein ABL78_2427 [Leptomonas seymouri]|eukprot:KPI88465.1 hypothetical protein ABL78_2427 [Leptomonas seymouri]
MTTLHGGGYSNAFPLDDVGSSTSSHQGQHVPATFKPIPLKSFSVVVSLVPADQLRLSSSPPSALPNLVVEGAGGAAGVGGPTCMASSVPATGAVAHPGLMANASFSAAGPSFAFTKSFGDVFALKRPSRGGGGGPLASSGHSNSSLGGVHGLGASSAAAAAAAAVKGLADPSVSETPVPNSQDSYRIHLLLPAEYQQSSEQATPAYPSAIDASTGKQPQTHGSADTGGRGGGGEGGEGLSAATSSLALLRTPKRKQVAQVSKHWVLFQQLVRFVLSMIPRFEPPPTPPGFAFPVDLCLSFVQNSSFFSAAEATQQVRVGGGSPSRLVPSDPSPGSSPAAPSTLSKSTTQDPLVSGAEREARRAYMEAYLNLALQCDQVSCLKELQSFVGYNTYVKSGLADFRAMLRAPSSGDVRQLSTGDGQTEALSKNPLHDASSCLSCRPQYTVSTPSSAPRRADGNTEVAAAVVTSTTAPLASTVPETARRTSVFGSLVPSSRASEVSSQHAGSLGVSPPMLARSQPHYISFPSTVLDEPQRSLSSTAAAVELVASAAQSSATHPSGSHGVPDTAGAKTPLGVSASGVSGAPSLSPPDGASLTQGLAKPATRRKASSTASAQPELAACRTLTRGESAAASTESALADTSTTLAKRLAQPPSSSGSHHPLGSSGLLHSRHSLPTYGSLLLDAAAFRVRSEGNEAIGDDGGSSVASSHSDYSSLGSSASHSGSERRRGHNSRHRQGHDRYHHRRELRSGKQHDEPGYAGRNDHAKAAKKRPSIDGAEGVAAPPAIASEPAAAATAGITATAATAPSRTHAKALVPIGPETQRMLEECFRMMDTQGCGYASATDCLRFYLCATPGTLAEVLHLYASAASQAEDAAPGAPAEAAAGRIPHGGQLEALLPSWMRDCESVVVGNPDYLMSCSRFVDAVREILAVLAAMEHTFAAANTAGPVVSVEADKASLTSRSSKTQVSAGGNGVSHSETPASSAPSRRGLPAVLTTSTEHAGSARSHFIESPVPVEDAECDGSAVGAIISPLESWIDSYWLLMYSHVFSAVAALVVGAEAAGLRAALLGIRQKAYLEMTAQVATVVAAAAALRQQNGEGGELAVEATAQPPVNPPNLPVIGAAPPLELVYPPWLLQEAASAIAAQPPILGCFDALELLSLLYVMCEGGIGVVGMEDVLRWLSNPVFLSHVPFNLDEFASVLDVLSCSLPFADVLHCLRRCSKAPPIDSWSAGDAEAGARKAGSDSSSASASRQQHAHLLRLVSRCATADPVGGREFNELVQEQRWRRGGDAGGRNCAQCQLTRGVLEQQALLLDGLSDENLKLQRRVAELEAAAATVAAAPSAMPMASQASTNVQQSATNTATATTTTSARRDAIRDTCSSAVRPLSSLPPSPASNGASVESKGLMEEGAQRGADVQVSSPMSESPAASPPSEAAVRAPPHPVTIELVPAFTSESDEADDNNDSMISAPDALSHHRSPKQVRVAETQVARAGPLLYTVPPKLEGRQPHVLRFNFYLCRTAQRERKWSSAGAVSSSSGGTGAGGGPSAAQASPPVERITVRDTAGRRVVALKLSNNVLYVLGRDVHQRPARLPLVTAPLSKNASQHHRTSLGASSSPSSPVRHPQTNAKGQYHVNVVLGRVQNMLYPNYEGADCDGRNSPYSLMCRGNALGSSLGAAPCNADGPGRDLLDRSATSGGERSVTQSDSGFPSATTRASIEDSEPQRSVLRVELKAHTWFVLQLRMNWELRTVDVVVTCAAAASTTTSPHRTCCSVEAGERASLVYEGRVRMLDAATVTGLSYVEICPRRELLVAYCNMLIRYEAECT